MLAELLCSVDISADYKNISGNCNCNCKLMNAAEVLGHSGPWFLAGGLSSRLLHRVTRANTTNTITQEDSITQANTITPSNTIKWLKTITPINTIIQAKGQPPRPNRLFFLTLFKRPLTPPSPPRFWTFMLRIILRIIAPNSAQKCTKFATKFFEHGVGPPPPRFEKC